jgi:pectinesterase
MRIVLFFVFLQLSVLATAQQQKITVAQDGTGDYKNVQAAFDAVPAGNTQPLTIFIRKGIYKERLVLEARKDFITLVGEDKLTTILTFDNHTGKLLANGDTINTRTSASFFIYANDFAAENITFENNAGFAAGQAVAVFAQGDRLKFNNCRFVGFQDVLFCSGTGSRQFYQNCYIEGTTDFIFGPATAVFQSCLIQSKKDSHITAASTPKEVKYGFVFFDCTLTSDENATKVSLGRPWRPYSSVTYIRCSMDRHIIPAGWDNWRNSANEATARYAEFGSTGPGGAKEMRVSWMKHLSEQEVKSITLNSIFGDWNPIKK